MSYVELLQYDGALCPHRLFGGNFKVMHFSFLPFTFGWMLAVCSFAVCADGMKLTAISVSAPGRR